MDRDRLDEELDTRTPGDDGQAGDPGDQTDDQDEREPQPDEAQGDERDDEESEEQTPEQLRAEVTRLRRTNDQLTRMKSNYEKLQDDYESLLEEEQPRGRRRPAREADDDEDQGPVLSEKSREYLRENPEIAEVLGVISGRVSKAFQHTEKRIEDLGDRVRSRGIPIQDEGAVDRLMASGEFKTRRAAHMALLGIRAQKAQRRPTTERRERPAREPAERPPVATTRRGLTPRARGEAGIATLAEHRRKMDKDGPGYDPKYVQRYRNGEITVARKR